MSTPTILTSPPTVKSPRIPEVATDYGSPVILNYGASGTGKTTAIRTLCACPQIKQVRVIATEAQTLSRLRDLPADKIAIQLIAPLKGSGAALLKRIETITKVSWDMNVKNPSDTDKAQHNQLVQLLRATVEDFKDIRTGTSYGPIVEWEPNVVLVLDNLTGLGAISLAAICGLAVVRSQPQYYAAMQTEVNTLTSLINDTQAWKIILAHDDAYRDPTTGRASSTLGALGQKNAPLIQRLFGDIILSKVKVDGNHADYYWTNMEDGSISKPGILPSGTHYSQDYRHIVEAFYGK